LSSLAAKRNFLASRDKTNPKTSATTSAGALPRLMPSQASIWRPIEGCQSQRESKEHFEREIMYLADPGFPQAATVGIAEAKARQSSKIRELRIALRSAGLITLEEQARALGLSRSTTWKLLKADHKASGISARVISQILYAPSLPPLVRTTILEYVREK